MRIVFRADVNANVASGHLMRCLAVAEVARKMGHDCIFFLAEEINTEILRRHKFCYKVLDGHWDAWDLDIDKTIQAVESVAADVLVVDSYKITKKFAHEVAAKIPVFYFDDLCREQLPVTIALHHSEWDDECVIKDLYANTNTKALYGMKYIPLRDEFIQIKNNLYKYERNKVLLTSGATDSCHILLNLVKRLLNYDLQKNYVVVCGRLNSDFEKICSLVENKKNFTIYQSVENMAELMATAEIAVTAGGNTVYELTLLQVPMVSFAFSDDQVYFLSRMQQRDMLIYVGDAREDVDTVHNKLFFELQALLRNKDKQKALSDKAAELTDGFGAMRIVEILEDMRNE